MIHKIVLSNKEDIPVYSDEELQEILQKVNQGFKFIKTNNGIFNPSFMVAIVPHSELNRDSKSRRATGMDQKKDPSPYAQLLKGKINQSKKLEKPQQKGNK